MFTVVQKKICMLGDFAVGKTSLMRRFVEGKFDDKYMSTIGVKISRKIIFRSYGQLNLLVWDMTGGDDFGTQARSSYLRGASAALVVCDLSRRETLTVLERYAQQMQQLNPQTPLVLAREMTSLHGRQPIDIAIAFGCPAHAAMYRGAFNAPKNQPISANRPFDDVDDRASVQLTYHIVALAWFFAHPVGVAGEYAGPGIWAKPCPTDSTCRLRGGGRRSSLRLARAQVQDNACWRCPIPANPGFNLDGKRASHKFLVQAIARPNPNFHAAGLLPKHHAMLDESP